MNDREFLAKALEAESERLVGDDGLISKAVSRYLAAWARTERYSVENFNDCPDCGGSISEKTVRHQELMWFHDGCGKWR